MPGIVGRVSAHNFMPEDTMDPMSHTMLHRPHYQTQTHCEDYFQTAVIHFPSTALNPIAVSVDGRYTAAFTGSIYEDWYQPKAGAASILERWQGRGVTALLDLNGNYLILLWDGVKRQLQILNDRLGQKSLYLYTTDETLYFASELKALLPLAQMDRSVDVYALAELLTFGHFQGNRTLLKNVSRFPGGSCLTWEAGRCSIEPVWKMAYREDARWADLEEASRGYFTVLQNSLRKRLEGKKRIGILVSGGLDSRILSGVLRTLEPDAPVRSWTTGHGHDHDSRFGKKIAYRIGSRHQTIGIPETYLQDLAEDYIWLMDGRVAADGCHRALIRNSALGKTDVLINGFLGDVLAGSNLLEKVWNESTLDGVAKIGFQYYGEGFGEDVLKHILKPNVFDRVQGAARSDFNETLRNADAETLPDHLNWLTIWFHLWGDSKAQVDLLSFDFDVATPMSDKYFIDFVLSLPATLRKDRKAYLQMLCRYFPQLAHIPRAGDGLPILRSRIRAALHWRWLKFYRTGLPKLSAGRLGGHPYAQYVHRREWFQRSNRAFIKSTLIANPVLEDLFEMDGIKRLVEQALDPASQTDLTKGISSLISFALFRKQMDAIRSYAKSGITVEEPEGVRS